MSISRQNLAIFNFPHFPRVECMRDAVTATLLSRLCITCITLLAMLQFSAAFAPSVAFSSARPFQRFSAKIPRRFSAIMPAATPEGRSSAEHLQLLQALDRAPRSAGVYVMKNAQREIMYIGKSVCIKARMDSYFRKQSSKFVVSTAAGVSDRIAYMTELVTDIEYTVTPSATDALLLEAALIKAHQPPFNVLLKDDKRYPYVCVAWSKTYPDVFIARQKHEENMLKGDRYFGPFPDRVQLQQLMKMMKQTFRLKQRPGALFATKSAASPEATAQLVSPGEYRERVELAQMVLEGRVDALLAALRTKEDHHARREQFQDAIQFRDMGLAVERALHGNSLHFQGSGQAAVLNSTNGLSTIDESPVDVVGVNTTSDTTVVTIIKVRKSRITLQLGFTCDRSRYGDLSNATDGTPDDVLEAIQRVLEQHYAGLAGPEEYPAAIVLPPTIQLPGASVDALQNLFANRSAQPVAIGAAGSPESEHLASFATQLAHQASTTRQLEMRSVEEGLLQLSEMLHLLTPPSRIEGMDVSHIQGTNTVASCVVFDEGEPVIEQYRTFRIPQSDHPGAPNDYFSLQEAIRRRFKSHAIPRTSTKRKSATIPDVLLIDGGKGQLSATLAALQQEGIELPCVVALAKDKEEVFVAGASEPISSGYDIDSPAMRLLRRVRDEAHRHALSRHRYSRSVQMFKSTA